MPHFTSDWFSHNLPNWIKIFKDLSWDAAAPKVAVEIGSFEGRSTLWIAANLLKNPESRLYCVDTFQAEIEGRKRDVAGLHERFLSNVAASPDRDKIKATKGEAFSFLLELYREGVRADFVYVDGSHLAADVLQDLILSFSLLKVGGLIVCDDYLWSMEAPGVQDVLNSPKIAIDAFTNIFRRKISIIPRQSLYQLAFVKISA